MVSGDGVAVAERLPGLLDDGMGEVLAMPVIDPQDREGSLASAFAAVAAAGRALG